MKPDEYRDRFIYPICPEAEKWLETQSSLAEAWNDCKHGGWMWWALMYDTKSNHITRKLAVAFAKFCANAAKRAKGDTDYIWAAANAANCAANCSDYAGHAADAADYATAAVHFTARAEVRKAQADWIRKHVKNPFPKG